MLISVPTKSFIITYIKLFFAKLPSILVSGYKHMSILLLINSRTAPILFLKEVTFSAPIVTLLTFCNLCKVTDGKTSFSALSSAELFLLNDLLLSTVGLTGLSVLVLFALKRFFYPFCYIRFFFFCFVFCCHAGFVSSSIHIVAKVFNKVLCIFFIQMNCTFVENTQNNVLVINKRQLPNSEFIFK